MSVFVIFDIKIHASRSKASCANNLTSNELIIRVLQVYPGTSFDHSCPYLPIKLILFFVDPVFPITKSSLKVTVSYM